MMNRVLTPKDALKEMKEKCDGRLFAERQGFNIIMLYHLIESV